MEPFRAEPNDEMCDDGSIDDVTARLFIWGSRAPSGLARVEFHSEFARRRVVENLGAKLAEIGVPFNEIELPLHRPPMEGIRFIIEHTKGMTSGVVSVTGFATAFPEDMSLRDALLVFNFHRENLAAAPVCQIWWTTPEVTDILIRHALDLNSWFIVREHLTEIIRPPDEDRLSFKEFGTAFVNIDDARRRSAYLAGRIDRALEVEAGLEDILSNLAIPAVMALSEAGARREADELEHRLAGKIADSFKFDNQSRPTEPTFTRLLEITRSDLLSNDVFVLDDLGTFYAKQERPADAELMFRKALEIHEQVLGPDHLGTAQNLEDLAPLLAAQGHCREAEEYLRRVIAVREKSLGPRHLQTAASFNKLANVFLVQHRYLEAEPLFRKAIEIQADAEIPLLDTASSLNSLANLLWSQGRHGEAEPLHRRALDIREKTLGADHPDTAQSLNNLAVLLNSRHRYSEAEPLYRRACAIVEKTLGLEHGDTKQYFRNHACLLEKTGRPDEAAALLARIGESPEDLGSSSTNLHKLEP